MVTDFTQGSISKKLWLFSIPMLISVMFQQFYNLADSMIAGKYADVSALAAIGASYPITMLFMAVAIGSNIGCSVVISQLFGAKNHKKMNIAISTSLLTSLGVSLLLTAAGMLLSGTLLHWLNTPSDIFHDARLYLKIYIGGLTFLFLYNICTGIFNALGDSKTPLYLLIFSSIGNIALDLWFVRSFGWGVAGVAWATFLAQGAACVLSIFLLLKKLSAFGFCFSEHMFSFSMLAKIGKIAVPSILQQSFISVGNIFIQRLINQYGAGVIAGASAAMKLNTFAITSFTTLANGLSSFSGQNIGAKKPERIKKGFLSGSFLALITAVPFFLLFFFFCRPILNLFMDSSDAAMLRAAFQTGQEFLRMVSPFYFIICLKLMADGVLRGCGAMTWFMTATFTDLILRVLLAFLLSPSYKETGIWMSWPIGWTIATAMSVSFYKKGVWKLP